MLSLCNAVSPMQLARPLDYSELLELVAEYRYKEIEASQLAKAGWAPPVSFLGDTLAYETDRFILLRWLHMERILPQKAIDNAVKEKIAKMEAEGERINKKVKDSVRDEVVADILSRLPKSFVKDDSVYLLIDKHSHRIYVLTASQSKVDDALAYLRKTIGSLPVSSLNVDLPVGHVMAQWLINPATRPSSLKITGTAVLESLNDTAKLTCRNEDLDSKKILAHLDGDDPKWPVAMGLEWFDDKSTSLALFTLDCVKPRNNSFFIKSLRFAPEIDLGINSDSEDLSAHWDAEFLLGSTLITQLVDIIAEAMSDPQPKEKNDE